MADQSHDTEGSSTNGDAGSTQPPEPNGTVDSGELSSKELSRQQSRSISAKEASRTVGTSRKGTGKRPAGRGRPGSPTSQASPTAKSSPVAKASPTGKATASPKGSPAGKAAGGSKTTAGGKPTGGRNARAATNGARGQQAAKPRPRAASGRAAAPRHSRTTLLTVGVVILVLAIVVVLVVVKLTGGGGSGTTASDTPLPASVANDIATVPASVFDTVGITSAEQVTPPTVLSGQPPLTYTVNGKTLPGMLYIGAEYCPYCAAERWSIATAMSRFGKFTNLQATESTSLDIYPNTQTLSFHSSTFASSYLAFKHAELYTNQPAANGNGYQPLEKLTSAEAALAQKYESSKYVGAAASTSGGITFPFVDIGNKIVVVGAGYSPSLLTGLSRAQIASDLHDASNPVTQAIIANANYLSAGMCAATGGQPGSVCTSKGVTEAAKALKLQI